MYKKKFKKKDAVIFCGSFPRKIWTGVFCLCDSASVLCNRLTDETEGTMTIDIVSINVWVVVENQALKLLLKLDSVHCIPHYSACFFLIDFSKSSRPFDIQ